jgi:hypothetical protein
VSFAVSVEREKDSSQGSKGYAALGLLLRFGAFLAVDLASFDGLGAAPRLAAAESFFCKSRPILTKS